MVQRKSLRLLSASMSIIISIAFCLITIHTADAPNYIVKYFIGPIFVYIPFFILLIAVIIYNLNMYIIKNKQFKILTAVLICIVIVYYMVCFSLIGYYNFRYHDKIFDIKNISPQVVNNIFFENIQNLKSENIQDSSYVWGDSLLIEYSDNYDIKHEEITDSIYVDIYCLDNFVFSEKIKNKIKKTYFYSEYAYNMANTEFDNNSIVTGEKKDVSFQYCCITATNNAVLKNNTYFTVLLEDDNSVFLISIRAYQKERTTIDIEREIDSIMALTNCLWNETQGNSSSESND